MSVYFFKLPNINNSKRQSNAEPGRDSNSSDSTNDTTNTTNKSRKSTIELSSRKSGVVNPLVQQAQLEEEVEKEGEVEDLREVSF